MENTPDLSTMSPDEIRAHFRKRNAENPEAAYSAELASRPDREPSLAELTPDQIRSRLRQQNPQPEEDESSFWDRVERVGADLVASLPELPGQIAGGLRDAEAELIDFSAGVGKDIGDWFISKGFHDNRPEWVKKFLEENDGDVDGVGNAILSDMGVPNADEADTGTGSFVRSLSQFAGGFALGGGLMKSVGIANTGFAAATVKGAFSDAFAFDPKDPRFSDLINEHFPDHANDITEYLASDPSDSEAEARLKMALEGAALGIPLEGVLRVFRGVKGAIQAKRGTEEPVLKDVEPTVDPLDDQPDIPEPPKTAAEIARQDDFGRLVEEARAVELGDKAKMDQLRKDTDKFLQDDTVTEGQKTHMKAILNRLETSEVPSKPVETFTPDDADDVAEAMMRGDFDGASKKVAGRVNLDYIQDEESYHQVLEATTKVYDEHLIRGHEAVKMQAAQEAASEMGIPLHRLNVLRKESQGLDSRILAARSLLVSSTKRITELLDAAAKGDQEAQLALRKAMVIHGAIQKQVAGIQTEVGRALNAMKISATDELFRADKINSILEGFGGQGVNADYAKYLKQILENSKNPMKSLNDAARKGRYARTRDALLEMYIQGMLSNPKTQLVNLTGNFMVTMSNVIERAIAAGIGPKGGVAHGESVAMLHGYMGSFIDALRAGGKAIRTGEPSDHWSKLDYMQDGPKAISKEALELSGNWGRAIDYAGHVLRIPGRLLVGGDEFFKTMNYRAQLRSLAYRKALEKSKGDKEMFERLYGEYITNPPRNVQLEAKDFAHYSTFQKELGEGGNILLRVANKYPAMRLFLPFIKTPVNLLKFWAERTPMVNKLMGEVRADLASGDPHKIAMVRSKQALGSALYMTGFAFAINGNVTGAAPKDPELRRRMEETGWKPYSFVTTDENGNKVYHPYNRMDPFGSFFGWSADLVTLGSSLSEGEYEEAGNIALASLAGNLTEKTYLKGLNDLITVGLIDQNWDRAMNIMENVGSNLFLPYNSLMRGITKSNDPIVRETNGLFDKLMAKVPGFSEGLPPKRNILGEAQMYEEGYWNQMFNISPGRERTGDSKVLEEVARLKVDVSGTERFKRINGVDISLEQRDYWAREWGKLNKRTLEPKVNGAQWDKLPDGKKAHILELALTKNREAARRKTVGHFPDLVDAKREEKLELEADIRRENITPFQNF